MVERRTPNPDAGGSSPSWPAIYVVILQYGKYCINRNWLKSMGKKTKAIKRKELEKVNKSPFSPSQIKAFIDEVKVEFTKIVWPDKKTTLSLTGVVIVFSILASAYLGSVDMLLGKLIDSILR